MEYPSWFKIETATKNKLWFWLINGRFCSNEKSEQYKKGYRICCLVLQWDRPNKKELDKITHKQIKIEF